MGNKVVHTKGLLDTGADIVLIHQKFVNQHQLSTVRLPRPLNLTNADGSANKAGQVTHRVEGNFIIKGTSLPTHWYVADIGKEDIIFGVPWVRSYNPTINWATGKISFNNKQIVQQQRIRTYRQTHDPPSGTLWGLAPVESINDLALAFTETTIVDPLDDEILTHNPDKVIDYLLRLAKQKPQQVNKTNVSTEIAIEASKHQKKKTLDEILPTYLEEYREVFEKEAADRFPPERPWDHAIDLKEDYVPTKKENWGKIYPLAKTEHEELQKFIEENMAKGYIRKSKSPLATPFFFVKKKDGSLRPVQDYRALNARTVKNAYPLPLISDLMDRLQGANIFSKLDVRAGYNNVRIKEGDQWKAAFITPFGLFEPTVMFFGLCNAPATFQSMMNHIFSDMLAEGWLVIYMDDILIFSNNIDEHRKRTRRVVQRMKDQDLFLKGEKCEFEVTQIEFLGSIIRPGEIAMDPIKVKAITDWEPPRTVKQVQAFLGFGNFYRRFIRDYSTLAKPLTELTKKAAKFEWSEQCEQAFQILKTKFTEEPILRMPDLSAPFQVECDASKVATGGVLRQQGPNGIWHPCAYLSQSFTEAERNYQIYDRELLAVIRAFKAWRHFLLGSPHPVQVITDHQNLTYFRTAQRLNARQARWHVFLGEFNYQITHHPGKGLIQADALSRRTGHNVGEDDNKDIVVLPDKIFTINAVNISIQEQIRNLSNEEPPEWGKKDDWAQEDGLLIFKHRVYVPPNNDLRRKIVKLHHDPAVMGHPGIQKTLAFVQREYIWEGMQDFITQYVRGCATCQTCKVNTHPIKPTLMPIPHSGDTRPWQTITIDHITDLPLSNGYDAIQVVVDHDVSKAAIFTPCNKTITATECMRLLWTEVFSLFGFPAKIISDRGPQFASTAFQELHNQLGIHTSLSTAYHPQTDGQTERVNQEIDAALRFYCTTDPEGWSGKLKEFQFAHNTRSHSVTKKSPSELLFGYQPTVAGKGRGEIKHPNTEERLKELQKGRENTIVAHALAAEAMRRRAPGKEITFKKGDKVLLEATNLKLPYPFRKFAPKREGPFEIEEVLGPITYKLALPKKWRIHPVFHASLLTPYRTTKEHGPDRPRPPPDIIEGEEEYEVEAILNHRMTGRKRKTIQYYVVWKGWEPAEDSWEPEKNLKNASNILNAYKKKHNLLV